jgi:5-hydroxyisourate hydrolase
VSHVTTHVLDAALGKPAAGIPVVLQHGDGAEIARGTTDGDGRIAQLGPERLGTGIYRLIFSTADYFARQRIASFYPRVTIDFVIADGDAHYHVPVLLSPFAYSTYRGS